MARGRCRGARHQRRLSRPRIWRGDWPVGAADGFIGGVYRDKVGGRGLSLLHRPEDAAVAPAPARRRFGHRQGCDSAASDAFTPSGVLAGRADQCAQPESGAVLSRLPAAIRGGEFTAQGDRLPSARVDLHFHTARCGALAWRRSRRAPPGASGNPVGRRCGSTARWAGCSSISESASPPFRPGEQYRSRCRRGRFRAKSSRSGTSGGRLRGSSASAPPVR